MEIKFTDNYITDALIVEKALFNCWSSFEDFDKYKHIHMYTRK